MKLYRVSFDIRGAFAGIGVPCGVVALAVEFPGTVCAAGLSAAWPRAASALALVDVAPADVAPAHTIRQQRERGAPRRHFINHQAQCFQIIAPRRTKCRHPERSGRSQRSGFEPALSKSEGTRTPNERFRDTKKPPVWIASIFYPETPCNHGLCSDALLGTGVTLFSLTPPSAYARLSNSRARLIF